MAKRSTALALGAVILLFVVIFGIKFGPFILMKLSGKPFGFQQPPASVSAVAAQARDWQPTLHAVATLDPVNGVDVATEVDGIVSRVEFKSGSRTRKGDLLILIDDSADRAELAGLEADLTYARSNLERLQSLIARNLTSREGLDAAQNALDRAEAAVRSKRALIAKKNIRAPFDGTLGIRNVNVGEYITSGKKLVALQDLETLYADFSVPQQEIRALAPGQPVRVTLDAYPGKAFQGRVTAVDSQVDDATHTLRVQATIANDGGLLRPGMYAVAEVELPKQLGVVVVPKTSITYSLYGDSVFVVRDNTAHRVPVKLGAEHDEEVVVTEGVAAGDMVVSAGQLKLQDGAAVALSDGSQAAAPTAASSAAPKK